MTGLWKTDIFIEWHKQFQKHCQKFQREKAIGWISEWKGKTQKDISKK